MSPTKASASLKLNTLINDTWLVTKQIAAGGFGKVFMVTNVQDQSVAAVKTQSCGKNKKGVSELLWEVYVMAAFGASRHCPRLIGYMENESMDMIVMELLGPTIRDIEAKLNWKPMPPGYAALIGRQCLSAVRDLHECYFIHRDIKPENFAFGMGDKCRRIYLIDFGMTKRYRLNDGRLLPQRRGNGFRGTILYASERAHRREELGAADDLMSLFYVIVEMFAGKLPWYQESDVIKVQQMKADYTLSELTASVGDQMKQFANYVTSLRYDVRPDYWKLDKLLKLIMIEHGVQLATNISWDQLLDEKDDINNKKKQAAHK
ncbi:hypothetical protein M513_12108 [Trichuris suis]|uniref:Protein kinase domain-containing protein n=1 Tax=Trichuris suis TaxID=68888 RepID=A0A085LPY0_9BILA|nr:hypothetical protein M513_12108 [Trichuris suis]